MRRGWRVLPYGLPEAANVARTEPVTRDAAAKPEARPASSPAAHQYNTGQLFPCGTHPSACFPRLMSEPLPHVAVLQVQLENLH